VPLFEWIGIAEGLPHGRVRQCQLIKVATVY
jgi:hypothetical protein